MKSLSGNLFFEKFFKFKKYRDFTLSKEGLHQETFTKYKGYVTILVYKYSSIDKGDMPHEDILSEETAE